MTQERFIKLLDNPDLLATISYEELKTLALTYPFVHNLRYLLAIKASQDNHPDFKRNLATAAAYSLDRRRLFDLISAIKVASPNFVFAEEEQVLELKPIETLQRTLDVREFSSHQSVHTLAREVEGAPDQSRNTESGERQVPALDLTRVFADTSSSPENTTLKHVNIEKPSKVQIDIPSFGEWISQFNRPILETVSSPETQPELTTTSNDEDLQENKPEVKIGQEEILEQATPQMLAEKSVTESKTIISETLAKLYIDQGYSEKAIDMYERLILAFPDKSAYFAAEIEKLKK